MKTIRILFFSSCWALTVASAWWYGRSGAGLGISQSLNRDSGDSSAAHGERQPGAGHLGKVEKGALDAEYPAGWQISYYQDGKVSAKDRMARVFEIEDPLERMSCYLEVLKTLRTDEALGEAMEEMRKNFDPRGRGRELSMLMGKWAALNPQAALAAAGKLEGRAQHYAVSTGLSTWTKSDPVAAKEWAVSNHTPQKGEEDEGNWHMVSVIGQLSKNNLDLAMQWAQEQPRSEARGQMMNDLVGQMTKQRGLEATQAWVGSLPEGPFRNGVTRKVAWQLTEKDPAKGAEWIETIANPDAKRDSMRDLLDHWANVNANDAGNWLRSKPITEAMDEPRKAFAWEIREKDPESAIIWANTLANPKQKDRLMVELAKDWARRDEKAAADFMSRNQWPEETMRKVLR